MRKFRLKPTSLAVAAALTGGSAVPVYAVNLASEGVGEVAIAPYYTTRDGWQTTINLINTQDVPIVVKVRIHEGRNSRDVLDFNVALSGFDVFSGVLKEGAGGRPVFVAIDQADSLGRKTCTIPNSVASGAEVPLSALAFGPEDTANDDGGPTGTTPTLANPDGATAEAIDRMKEGYVEFVVLGYAVGEDLGVGGGSLTAIGDAIESHNCSVLQTAFSRNINPTTSNPYILETARQFGEPINALKFNFTLLNPGRGVEAGTVATTWANFYNPAGAEDGEVTPTDNATCALTRGDERSALVNWNPAGVGSDCRNLITAQVPFDFLEPSLNDAYPQVANWWDDFSNAVISAQSANTVADDPDGFGGPPPAEELFRGVDAVSLTIQRSDIFNEWSSNPSLGVSTDWIVTMPTKAFYVDGSEAKIADSAPGLGNLGPGVQSAIIPSNVAAGIPAANFPALPNHNRPEAVLGDSDNIPYAPFANPFGQRTDGERTTASSCNQVQFVAYDRAEQRAAEDQQDDVIVSPAPPPVVETANLCYEVNVISFDNKSALNSIYPMLDTDGNPLSVSSAQLPAPGNTSGWMRLDLTTQDQGGLPFGEGVTVRGLPVTGFMLKQRTFGSVTKNFASSIDHAYARDFVGGL